MRKANLVKSFCGVLSLSLLFLMPGCSSSPEKQLNGTWDCKIGDMSHTMKLAVADGVIIITIPDGDVSHKAKIEKIDGDVINIVNPDNSSERGKIKFSNKDTITLIESDDEIGPVCTRK